MTHDQPQKPFHAWIDASPDAGLYRHQTRDWSPEQRETAARMASALHRAGCPDPLPWVFSELQEGLAQRARFAVLRELHLLAVNAPELLEEVDEQEPQLDELLRRVRDILSPQELALVMQGLTRIVCRAAADLLDAGQASGPEADGLPGWQLMETDTSGEPTGRAIGGLHEDMMDFRLGSGEPDTQG